MLHYIAAIPSTGGIVEKFYTDPSEAEEFARQYDRSPNGVYDCVATLKQRSRRRTDLGALRLLFWDVDVAHGNLIADPAEVYAKVATLPAPFEIRDSGGGRHVALELKEPPLNGTPALARAEELRSQGTLVLAADRMCDQSVSLLRRPGTHNYKYPGAPKCEILRPGVAVTLAEAGRLVGALGPNPWWARGAIDPKLNRSRIVRKAGGLDFDTALKEMHFGGAVRIHPTQLAATKGLMFDGVPLERTVEIVYGCTRDAARGDPDCASWNWEKERRKIVDMSYGAIAHDKYPQLYPMLPLAHREKWQGFLNAGKTPTLIKTSNIGWVVVEAPPKEIPTPVPDIGDWLRQVAGNAEVAADAQATHYATDVFLGPAIRAKGYFEEPLRRTAQRWRVTLRTVERARGLLIARGYLRRVPGGGRTPRLAAAYTTQVSDIER